MATIYAYINPKILKWARESMGYSIKEAADKIFGKRVKTRVKKLIDCENGNAYLTFNQFKKAVNVYHRSMEVFYLEEVPPEEESLPDFRMPSNIQLKHPQLQYQIRRIKEFREYFIKLISDVDRYNWSFVGSIQINHNGWKEIEEIALKIRDLLGVSFFDQQSWKDDRESLRFWISRIESLGVLVFKVPKIPLEIFEGFSIAKETFPVIVLNSKQDNIRRMIFTLLHEFSHILLDKSGICTPIQVYNKEEDSDEFQLVNKIEVFCNYLAGAILVPRKYLLDTRIVKDHPPGAAYSDGELQSLSRIFRVSKDVIARRLLISGRISRDFYQIKHKEYSGYLKKTQKKEGKGGPPPERVLRSQLSEKYIQTVFDALKTGRISEFEAINLLDTSPKIFNRLLNEIY